MFLNLFGASYTFISIGRDTPDHQAEVFTQTLTLQHLMVVMDPHLTITPLMKN